MEPRCAVCVDGSE